MRLVLQRVSAAKVDVDGETVGEIGRGLLALAGFGHEDLEHGPDSAQWDKILSKCLGLRIFPDEAGKLNLDLSQAGGGLLLVPQFTLYADCRKGRRPSFSSSAPPETARRLFDLLVSQARERFAGKVAAGRFGADMQVSLVNDGPVTIILDTTEL